MRPLSVPIRFTASALLILFLSVAAAQAQDSGKPLLSEEIRRVLEADGPEAAQRRFDEIFPVRSDRYEMDMQGMAALASEKLQANDMASAQVVLAMVAAVAQPQAAASQAQAASYTPETTPAAAADQRERGRARGAQEKRPVHTGPGQARDDVKRFAGWYGVPGDQQDPPRNLFAQETCDGYLVAGASWGDAEPWHLTSVSETSFEYSSSFGSFTMEFEVDGDGNPVAMIHDIGDLGFPSRLEYLGPLEDGQCFAVERGQE